MISAIGSDVATWHPPPPSYEMDGHGSGDCETHGVGLSGAVASLVFVVPHVTRLGTGRWLCALGMICLCERGDAGLVPAVGLIRSLSALWA
jgi:hypothetical protein